LLKNAAEINFETYDLTNKSQFDFHYIIFTTVIQLKNLCEIYLKIQF